MSDRDPLVDAMMPGSTSWLRASLKRSIRNIHQMRKANDMEGYRIAMDDCVRILKELVNMSESRVLH